MTSIPEIIVWYDSAPSTILNERKSWSLRQGANSASTANVTRIRIVLTRCNVGSARRGGRPHKVFVSAQGQATACATKTLRGGAGHALGAALDHVTVAFVPTCGPFPHRTYHPPPSPHTPPPARPIHHHHT